MFLFRDVIQRLLYVSFTEWSLSNYLKRLFEFHANPTEFLGFSVKVFLSKVLMVISF